MSCDDHCDILFLCQTPKVTPHAVPETSINTNALNWSKSHLKNLRIFKVFELKIFKSEIFNQDFKYLKILVNLSFKIK